MGLGRTTRFAPLPAGARRVSVMRRGSAGLPVLAPSSALLRLFERRTKALMGSGLAREAARVAAWRQTGYGARFRAEIRARPAARQALRRLVAEARGADVYLMCMCPYRTRERACHTYLLLDMARALDRALTILPEPEPARPRRAAGSQPARQASQGHHSRSLSKG